MALKSIVVANEGEKGADQSSLEGKQITKTEKMRMLRLVFLVFSCGFCFPFPSFFFVLLSLICFIGDSGMLTNMIMLVGHSSK